MKHILLLLLALALAGAGHGETVLSSLGDSVGGTGGMSSTLYKAQAFRTPASGSYKVVGVSLGLGTPADASGQFWVAIVSGEEQPNLEDYFLLDGPANPTAAGTYTFTAHGEVLRPDTTYWIVGGVDSGPGYYRWNFSTTDTYQIAAWPTVDKFAASNDEGDSWTVTSGAAAQPQIFSINAVAASALGSQGTIYTINDGAKLKAIDVATGAVTVLADLATYGGAPSPYSWMTSDLCYTSGKLWFNGVKPNGANGPLLRSYDPVSGVFTTYGQLNSLAGTGDTNGGLAVDAEAGYAYYGYGNVYKDPLNALGTGTILLATPSWGNLTSIAVDPAIDPRTQTVYLVGKTNRNEGPNSTGIFVRSGGVVTSTTLQSIYSVTAGSPRFFQSWKSVFDFAAQRAYYVQTSDNVTGQLIAVDLASGHATTVLDSALVSAATDLALDPASNTLFFTGGTAASPTSINRLYALNADGTNLRQLAELEVTGGNAAIAFVPASASQRASQRFRNATLAWYDDAMNASFDDATLHRLIDHLKTVGYDGITFQMTVDTDTAGNVLNSKPKTRMWQMLDYAAEIGLGTAIQVNWSAGGNVALDVINVPPNFSIPTFLQGVRPFFQELASTAQAHGVSLIYLGYHSDNVVTAQYRTQWSAIVADIRAVFTGRISYIGWYGSPISAFDDIAIWDLLDAIGVEPHMDYVGMPLYASDEIQAGYFHRPNSQDNVVTDLIGLSRKYGKPLVFGSLFFMSLDNALDNWDPTPAQALQDPLPLNPAAQKAGYQAALEVIAKNLDGFVFGINFSLYEPWEYQTFTTGGSFSASDAAVLNAFKYVGALAGPTTDFTGTEAEQLIAGYLHQPWGYHATDVTSGGPGDDIIYVGSGDNTIYAKGGRDEIHGGTGFDTVVIAGKSDAFSITTDATSVIVRETADAGNAITADRINLLHFDDRSIDVHHPAAPVLSSSPAGQAAAVGQAISLAAAVTDGDAAFQWQLNGSSLAAATNASLSLENLQPENSGVYTVRVTNSVGSTDSAPAIVGLQTTDKVVGAGAVVGSDIPHPNGHIFDQVLMSGRAEAITSEGGKVTRTSFIDLNDDIVQVELSGPGTLSLVLDAASDPAAPLNYNQPTVSYAKGHAGLVITGATEATNVSVFTVGRATAFDPTGAYDILAAPGATNDPAKNGSSLFVAHEGTRYDGIADIAFIAIASADGKFGGVRTANAHYFASRGLTGVYAPGVAFQGPVFVGNVSAFDTATPVLQLGSAGDVRVTGGDLLQDNGRAVQVSGITQLKFADGSDSHGHLFAAKSNRARLEQDGVDVTDQIVANPAP